MKISLLQKCGLGNQLFQYAAAMYYAQKYKAEFEVILEAKTPVTFYEERSFLLSHYCITAPVRKHTVRDLLMCSVAPHKRPVAGSARFLTGTVVYRQPLETDRVFVPTLPVNKSTNFLYLDGFFQAYEYAARLEREVRQQFTMREPATGANLEYLNAIRAAECPVSLHVRRGDYTVLYNGRYSMPLSYFHNAMQTMRERVGKPKWFVFSDDIPWVKENLPHDDTMVFCEGNDSHHAHEDLRLMSACKHHVIANSTFSWWGAWLNPNADKVVIAPKIWLDPLVPDTGLIPPEWLRIDTE